VENCAGVFCPKSTFAYEKETESNFRLFETDRCLDKRIASRTSVIAADGSAGDWCVSVIHHSPFPS